MLAKKKNHGHKMFNSGYCESPVGLLDKRKNQPGLAWTHSSPKSETPNLQWRWRLEPPASPSGARTDQVLGSGRHQGWAARCRSTDHPEFNSWCFTIKWAIYCGSNITRVNGAYHWGPGTNEGGNLTAGCSTSHRWVHPAMVRGRFENTLKQTWSGWTHHFCPPI